MKKVELIEISGKCFDQKKKGKTDFGSKLEALKTENYSATFAPVEI